jgi:hypothetical protein
VWIQNETETSHTNIKYVTTESTAKEKVSMKYATRIVSWGWEGAGHGIKETKRLLVKVICEQMNQVDVNTVHEPVMDRGPSVL